MIDYKIYSMEIHTMIDEYIISNSSNNMYETTHLQHNQIVTPDHP